MNEHQSEQPRGRGRATVDRISRAALELSRSNNDGEFALRDVAEVAGIALGTLHTHFPSREALLQHVEEVFWAEQRLVLAQFVAAHPVTSDVTTVIGSAVAFYMRHIAANAGTLLMLRRSTQGSDQLARVHRRHADSFMDEVLAAASHYLGARWTPAVATSAPVALRMLVSVARDSVMAAHCDPQAIRVPPDRLPQQVADALLLALGLSNPAAGARSDHGS